MWSLLRYSCRLVQLSDLKGGSWVFVEKKKKPHGWQRCWWGQMFEILTRGVFQYQMSQMFFKSITVRPESVFLILAMVLKFSKWGNHWEKKKKKRQEILAGNKSMLKNFYFIFFPRLNELKTDCEDNSLHSKCNMRQKLRQLLAWVAKQRRQPEGSREAIRRLKSKLLTGSICATLSPEKLLSRWFNVNS